jgi:hypothetical protein
VAREIVVHFSNGSSLTVAKECEAELQDALSKGTKSVLLRDTTGARNIANVSHIVRVELRF